jgi:LacI family transcriptional regulator, gluconate utilization system Gnt-I transcriptional repressor
MKSTMPDDKLLTSAPPRMADVARIAGVSKMTVSRVLAGRPVSAATRERVMDVVNQIGYVADAAAGALSSGRSSFVAVLVPSLSSSNFSDTVRGINDVIEPAGMQMLLANTDYDLPREEELVRALLRYQPRCIVLTGSHHTAETHSLLARARIPVIETWDMPSNPIDRVVGFSNAEASRAMVRHLYERGYERIAFVSSASKLDRRGIDRRRGYLKEVRAAGCEPRDITKSAWTTTMAHGVAMAHGAAALQQLLERWPDTDAVMCASDIHAFGAVMACHRLGLSVPGDIAVAGFGDFEVSRHCYPTITTVSVDAYGIGHATGESLLAALHEAEGEGKPDKTRGTETVVAAKRKPLQSVIKIHYEVVPREST